MINEKKELKKFKKKVAEWTEEERVIRLKAMLQMTNSGVHFIPNEDGLIVGYRMVFGEEENFFASDPIIFDWPMQPMPVPEAFQGRLN